MRIVLAALAALLLSLAVYATAFAQGSPTVQSGKVTRGHPPVWSTNGVIGDGGGAAAGALKELGIGNTGTPFCINSQPPTPLGNGSWGPPSVPYDRTCLGANDNGSGVITYDNVNGSVKPFQFIVNGVPQLIPGSIAGMPSVANNTALQALASTYSSLLLRQDYATGLGAPPLTYRTSNSACTLNSGAGDGGSQIPTSDGKCWIGVFPSTGVDVREFGADQTGTSDSSAAIAAADAFAAAIHKALYFSAGTYKVATCITPSTYANWYGDSRQASVLVTNSPSNCIINAANVAFTIQNMGLQTSVTRTSGSYMTIGASDAMVVRVTMVTPWTGLTLNAGTVSMRLLDLEIFDNFGDGMVVNDCLNCSANHLQIISGNNPASNLRVHNSGDFTCHDCSIQSGNVNIWMDPSSSQAVTSFKFIGGFVDHGVTQNVLIAPTGTGSVLRSNFDGSWFGSAPGNNVNINPSSGAVADGLTFSNCEAYLATAGSGFAVNGPASNIVWTGGKISQNNIGVFISNATHVTISDAIVGQSSGFGGNTGAGVSIGGSLADYIDVHDLQELTSNSPPYVAYTATPTISHTRIHDNPGYNSTGIVGITPSGSPFSYVNSVFPATVYGFGGNVTQVTQDSVAIINAVAGNAWQVNLAPNEGINVTYTSAPTMNSVTH